MRTAKYHDYTVLRIVLFFIVIVLGFLFYKFVIAPLSHYADEDAWEVVEATCETDGYKYQICTECGEHFNNKTIPATGHSYSEATCTEAKTCTVCGVADGNPLGHAWVEATCTEAKTCSRCDLVEGEAKGHTAGDAADCVNDQTCTECNIVLTPALGHTPDISVAENWVDSTCSAEGSYDEVTYCKVCSEEIERVKNSIEKLPHTDVVDDYVAPTCTDTGLTAGTHCSECGEVTIPQVEIDALGHTEHVINGNPATCTEDGTTDYTVCSTCGETLVAQEVAPATGHTPAVLEAVAPGCVDTGLTEGSYCSVCYITLVPQDEVAPLGHDFTDPTCTEGAACKVCGAAGKDALGHATVTDAKVDPTCTDTGLTAGSHCSRCNEVFVAQEEIPENGHTNGPAADCENNQICTVCEIVLKPALGHTPGTAADCENDQICTECNKVLVEAYGHSFEWNVIYENGQFIVLAECTADECDCGGNAEEDLGFTISAKWTNSQDDVENGVPACDDDEKTFDITITDADGNVVDVITNYIVTDFLDDHCIIIYEKDENGKYVAKSVSINDPYWEDKTKLNPEGYLCYDMTDTSLELVYEKDPTNPNIFEVMEKAWVDGGDGYDYAFALYKCPECDTWVLVRVYREHKDN